MIKDIVFTVEQNEPLTADAFGLKLKAQEKLPDIRAGQFLHLEIPDGAFLLRRPFCIYKFDDRSVTLVIAAVGKGTRALSGVKAGEKLRAVIPIGNGFNLTDAHKKVALIGGGVGCAPLLTVPKSFPNKEYRAYLGFNTKKSAAAFESDFKSAVSKTLISTDDSSYGFKGYVSDCFKSDGFKADVILTCGPLNMLKAVARLSAETRIPAYMSGESRMGCGVGACLVCACAVREGDNRVRMKRACVDGPVFDLSEIVL